jgi:Cof subfamily protein (haloacid dehalogenase superfamily)
LSRFKLIAIDLDDTLLDDNLQVSGRTREALKKAADKGVIVTIATGRMYCSALNFARDVGIDVPIITYQGALIKNMISGEVLVNRPVPLELAVKVLAAGYKAGVHMNVYLNDKLYVDSITPEGQAYAKLAGVEMNPVGNLIEFLQEDSTKVLYIGEPHKLDLLQKELQTQLGDRLYITKSKPNFLEFMHYQATKKHALQTLTEKYGVKREEVMAFGDSYNDLEMIEYAGMGIAMDNSHEEIKKKADYIADTNNNDGVAKVIEEFVL